MSIISLQVVENDRNDVRVVQSLVYFLESEGQVALVVCCPSEFSCQMVVVTHTVCTQWLLTNVTVFCILKRHLFCGRQLHRFRILKDISDPTLLVNETAQELLHSILSSVDYRWLWVLWVAADHHIAVAGRCVMLVPGGFRVGGVVRLFRVALKVSVDHKRNT